MGTVWSASLGRAYEAAIDMLEQALRACPDELWEASLWQVHRDDPGPGRGGRPSWPIERGMGADLPEEERIQIHSAFWYTAYHTLLGLDHYLSGGENPYLEGDAPQEPPPPFRADDYRNFVLPERLYTRDELQRYLDHCRQKAAAVIESLDDKRAAQAARRGHPYADILLHNLIHVAEHAGHLNMFLGQKGVRLAPPPPGPTSMEMLRKFVQGASDEELDAYASSQGGFKVWLNRVFQFLAVQIQPREDVAVAFVIDGAGEWTLRVAGGLAKWSSGATSAEATVHSTPYHFLRGVTGPAPADQFAIEAQGGQGAVRRLFAQMPPRRAVR